MGKFIDDLKYKYFLSQSSIDALMEGVNTIIIEPEQYITIHKQKDKNLYFVDKGLVKCASYNNDKEYIMHFAFEGEIAVTPTNREMNAKLTVTAIEKTALIYIDQYSLEALFDKYPDIALWSYRQLEFVLEIIEYNYLTFMWLNKQEQYKKIVALHPDILQRIPLKDIASYLNITQSSLSRIRAKI